VAGALTLTGLSSVPAGEVNLGSPEGRSPTYHASVTDFMAQAPKKKSRWWWDPRELLGFKKEEPKPKVAPLQNNQQITRPLPGTATGSYRGVSR
jgi:hypothetical protein